MEKSRYDNLEIGKKIRFSRLNAGWSKEELATVAGLLSAGTVSALEDGERAPSAAELSRLSEALKVDVADLVDPFSLKGSAVCSGLRSNKLTQKESELMETLALQQCGLTRWLLRQQNKAMPLLGESIRLNRWSSAYDGQQAAGVFRRAYSLGQFPGKILKNILQDNLGVMVQSISPCELSPVSRFDGLTVQGSGFDAILLNGALSERAQTWLLAHGFLRLGCAYYAELQDEVVSAFVDTLLMPQDTLTRQVPTEGVDDPLLLTSLANLLNVSALQLRVRLHNARMAPAASTTLLDELTAMDHGIAPAPALSLSMVQDLYVALEKGQLSARKAAKLLGLSLPELLLVFKAREMPAPFEL